MSGVASRAARATVLAAVLIDVAAGCGGGSPQPAEPERAETPQAVEPGEQRGQAQAAQAASEPLSYDGFITAVARGIEARKGEFPQLAEFSVGSHADIEGLQISYGYRTHRATHRGGWTSGVPNPDADGVWFYIDLHDPDSLAQIHTQPVVQKLQFRDKLVMVLLLDGAETEPLGELLHGLIREHGAR